MNNLGHDLDEMVSEAKMSEDKAQHAMIDAARLAEELRAEQESAMMLDRDKKLLEAQVKDAQARLDEAEQTALKGGKKAIAKMETRIRELESELDAENRRLGDASKNLRKSERRVKELAYTMDEDKKNQERMQALIDQLQGKIKSYKKQIEEAEEIAALNLAKYAVTARIRVFLQSLLLNILQVQTDPEQRERRQRACRQQRAEPRQDEDQGS